MPFEKGHKGHKNGGRPKGSKSGNVINSYNIHREWLKKAHKKVEDIDDINHYLYNDIPLEEYYNKKERKNENV